MENNQNKDRLPSRLNFPVSDKAKLLKNLKPEDFKFKRNPGFPIAQDGAQGKTENKKQNPDDKNKY